MNRLKALSLMIAVLLLTLSSNAAAAKAKPTPTPPLPEVPEEIVQEVPDTIQAVLDLAYNELVEANGKELKTLNKYTEWRGKGVKFGWCGGFVTWCMLEAGIPQEDKNTTLKIKEPVSGIVHVKEAGVGKLYSGYEHLNRVTEQPSRKKDRHVQIPQKGFIVVYGNADSSGKYAGITPYYHVGLVYDVEKLDNGCYRLTTIEGNVGVNFTDAAGEKHKATHTIRMYTRDYNPHAEKLKEDLTLVPEAERSQEESVIFSYDYTYGNKKMYISTFLMPWVPGDPALSGDGDAV